jgi:hypothetical protein
MQLHTIAWSWYAAMLAWPGPCVKSCPPHFSVLNPQEKHGGLSCSAQPAWQIVTVIVEATQQSSLFSLRKETSVAAKLLCWASGKPDWRQILWYVIRASDFLGVSQRTLPATLQPRHQGICIMKNSYCNIPLVSFFEWLISHVFWVYVYLRDNCGVNNIWVCLKQAFEFCRRHLKETYTMPSGFRGEGKLTLQVCNRSDARMECWVMRMLIRKLVTLADTW